MYCWFGPLSTVGVRKLQVAMVRHMWSWWFAAVNPFPLPWDQFPFPSTTPRWRCPAGIRPSAPCSLCLHPSARLGMPPVPHEEDCAGHHPHGCSYGDPRPRPGEPVLFPRAPGPKPVSGPGPVPAFLSVPSGCHRSFSRLLFFVSVPSLLQRVPACLGFYQHMPVVFAALTLLQRSERWGESLPSLSQLG